MKKKFLFLLLFLVTIGSLFADSINFSDSNYGADSAPVVSTITTAGIPAGSEITDIQITTSFGSVGYIGNWYDVHLNINGTDYTSVGWLYSESYSDLNNLGPNGLTITATTEDLDNYSDNGTLLLSVDVIYNPPAGTPDAPTLVSPANLATDVAIDTDLTWTTGANTDHAVLYLADNEEFTGADVVNSATSPYTTSLTSGTTYYWKVVAVGSSPDNIETPSAVYSFTTAFGVVEEFPYTEGFEGAWVGSPAAPAGWEQITVSGSNVWEQSTYLPHTGTKCAKAPYASAGGEHLLISPTFNFDASTTYRLKFWLKGSDRLGDDTDLQVQIAGSYTDANDFTTELAYYEQGVNMPTSWTEQIISLEGYSGNQAIAFRMIDDYGWALYIDDVTIEEIPQNPVVEIDTDPIAFGTIIINEESDEEIVSISNIGGGILNITDVSITGTDANQFSYTDTEDYALAGQEELLVSVVFNPTSEGAKTATLQITDDLTRTVYEITLTGTCVDPTLEVPITIDFEGSTAIPVEITNTNMGVSSTHGNNSNGLFKNIYGTTYQAYAQFQNLRNIEADTELNFEYRIVEYTGYPATARVLDEDDNIQIKVSNDGGVTYNVEYEVNSSNHVTSTAFKVLSIPLGAYTGETIIVKIEANRADGDYYVDFDNFKFRQIPATPIATLSATELDFGTVNVGETGNDLVSISNTGAGTLNISTIEISGTNAADFAFTPDSEGPWALANGDDLIIEVDFTPTAEGERIATLEITDDLGSKVSISSASKADKRNRAVNTVTLTGSGFVMPAGNHHDDPIVLTLADEIIETG
ncbi:choice-of-anchor D domain-containing protein, partial [bacterium]|nr:choice-of-anchor D domain-containing protein [bacterium]